MKYGNTIRKAALATAALSAALSLSACQPGGTPSAADSPSETAATSTPSTPPISSTPGTPAASPTSASPTSGSPSAGGKTEKTCAAKVLEATSYQASDRPVGTGTGAAVVEFKNVSAQPCTLQGYPTVAGAGNGSPDHNAPLKVTTTGSASPVSLSPGGKAWLKLTFVQVQGEADGYCKSGADPVTYPTLVIGLPGAGAHQVALEDGVFAECDNTVTATAVSGVKPS